LNSPNFFQKHARWVLIFAVMLGSTSGIITRFIDADAMAIGFYRLTFSLPFFLFPSLFQKRKEFKNIRFKDYVLSLLAGGVLFFHFYTWFQAVTLTTITSAIVLMELHPVVVLFITLFVFRKKVPMSSIAGITIALIGGILVTGGDYSLDSTHFLGDLYALMAAIGLGVYFVLGNMVRVRVPSGLYITLVFGSCWGFFFFGMVLMGIPFTGYSGFDYFYIALMTLLCQIGGHALFNWCLGYVSALDVSTLEIGEIIFAPILAFFFFKEVPEQAQWIGALIVIIGLLYYNNSQRKRGIYEL